MGYLVANPHQQNPTPLSQIWAFAQYNATYAFAQELQERFGVKHTLLGPPHFSTLPREQAARLNANLTVRFPYTPPPPEHKLNECSPISSPISLLPLPARPPAPIARSPAPRPLFTLLRSGPAQYFPAAFLRRVRGGGFVTYPPPYLPGKEVTVQAVRACPWPACVIVGCDMEKLTRCVVVVVVVV